MTLSPLDALTLTQPWATLSVARFLGAEKIPADRSPKLVLCPPKVHETRGYRISNLPRRIAIHAGKGDAQLRSALVLTHYTKPSVLIEPYASTLRDCGYSGSDPWGDVSRTQTVFAPKDQGRLRLPLGAIVGLVTITECSPTMASVNKLAEGLTDELDIMLGNWGPGRFAWRMEDAWLLPEPIACRGFQSIWKVGTDLLPKIHAMGGRW